MSISISSSEDSSCSSDSLDFHEFFTEILCYTDSIIEGTSRFGGNRDRITRFVERWKSLLSCHDIPKNRKWDRNESDQERKFRISETPEDRFFCE